MCVIVSFTVYLMDLSIMIFEAEKMGFSRLCFAFFAVGGV